MKVTLYIITFCLLVSFCSGQTWSWAKSGNGSGGSSGYGISTDSNGNIFITGSYGGPTIAFGPYSMNTVSGSCFLTKYDSNGNVLWAKSSTSSTNGQGETGISVATDKNGNAYVTGHFNNPTVTFDSYTLTSNGVTNAFLVKYDSNGNVLWAKSGQGQWSGGLSVCTDINGNVFMSGVFSSSVVSFGSYTLTNTGTNNIFLAKYDTNGNVLWAKTAQSTISNCAFSVSADSIGNTYVTGYFTGPIIVFGSYTLTNTGSQNIFLTKYDTGGNVVWAKSTIGSATDYAASVVADKNGDSYITGYFTSPTITFGSNVLTKTGNYNMFLAKYDSNGNSIWSKSSKGRVAGYSVSMNQNNIYLCGGFYDTLSVSNFTLSGISSSTNSPMFIIKYDLNGNTVYATSLTSGGFYQNAITVDNLCNTYITSDFTSNTPNLAVGTNTLISSGAENAFIAKLTFSCQTSGIEKLSKKLNKLLIYPNPNNGDFKILMDKEIEDGELFLFNSFGQKIYEQKIVQGSNDIKTNGLLPGLYYCILLQDNQTIGKGKLTIE